MIESFPNSKHRWEDLQKARFLSGEAGNARDARSKEAHRPLAKSKRSEWRLYSPPPARGPLLVRNGRAAGALRPLVSGLGRTDSSGGNLATTLRLPQTCPASR